MVRSLLLIIVALGLTTIAPSVLADDDPFFASVKADDIVVVRRSAGSSFWSVLLSSATELTEEQKQEISYQRVVRVTEKAIQLRSLNGKRERWIPWHAVSDVTRSLPDPAPAAAKPE